MKGNYNYQEVLHLKIVVTVRREGNCKSPNLMMQFILMFLELNCLSPNPQLPGKVKFPKVHLFPSRLSFLPLDVLVCFLVSRGMQKLSGSVRHQYTGCIAERPQQLSSCWPLRVMPKAQHWTKSLISEQAQVLGQQYPPK